MDAPCVATSRVTQKMFWCFNGVISSHRPYCDFKQVSFFTLILIKSDIQMIFESQTLSLVCIVTHR